MNLLHPFKERVAAALLAKETHAIFADRFKKIPRHEQKSMASEAEFLRMLNFMLPTLQRELHEFYICMHMYASENVRSNNTHILTLLDANILLGQFKEHDCGGNVYKSITQYDSIPERLELFLFNPSVGPLRDIVSKHTEPFPFRWIYEDKGPENRHHAQARLLSIELPEVPKFFSRFPKELVGKNSFLHKFIMYIEDNMPLFSSSVQLAHVKG